MELGKRVSKAPVRLVEDPNFGSQKNQDKPANKQQPRKQAQKPAEASKSPVIPTTNTTNAPARTKKAERRVLNLDLPDVPPSEYEKYVEDWSLPDNPFWRDNFHTPQDNTTQEYMEASEKIENLPASFVLRRDIETAFGVGNLELNPNLVKPIKRIPLFSKLEKGEYETVGSKSDKTNIAGSIKFIKNNLAKIHHKRRLKVDLMLLPEYFELLMKLKIMNYT